MANTKTTTTESQKPKFPTEIVDLPSRGYFYPEESTLSQGQVEIKYMTAREEDILTSANLIKKGKVLDKLFEAVIVGNGEGAPINMSELLLGDKNAIMFACRILGYGKEYVCRVQDVQSGIDQEETIDLTSLDHKEIKFENFTQHVNAFPFTLPSSKREVILRLLTHQDEKNIEQELKGLKKLELKTGISSELSTRVKHMIIAVDGNDDSQHIRQFVDNELLSRDSLALREYLVQIQPDIDTEIVITNENDGTEVKTTVPLTVEFFWPKTRT